jgi:hypothetical protein
MKAILRFALMFVVTLSFLFSCQPKKNAEKEKGSSVADIDSNTTTPIVLIYNFHGTHRCPSCVAIENATIETLNSFYREEVKAGKIKRFEINIDDPQNEELCKKYEAYGSSIYVTKILKGKAQTKNLTGEGFKFALNKKEKFIEILKSTIDQFLKEE